MTDELVRTRTCPECGHKHSLGASTQSAASFVSEVEARADELTEAVKEAARLLHDVLYEKGCSADPAVTAWLSLPIVKASEGA